jgi:S-adenosylmethionine uptake transporter
MDGARSDDLRGALCAVATALAFSVNDALAKAVMQRLPMAQVLAVRGVMVSALLALLVTCTKSWRRPSRALALRTLADALGSTFFLTALSHMPQASVTAIVQALPLAVVATSSLRGERIGGRGWLCVCGGLAGVLAVVRPGASILSRYSLFALVAVAIMTLRDVVTRSLPAAVPSLLVAQFAALANMGVGGVLLLTSAGWQVRNRRAAAG